MTEEQAFQTEGPSFFRQNDIKTYCFNDILLRHSNIVTMCLVTDV